MEDDVQDPGPAFIARSISPSVPTMLILTVPPVCGSRIEILGRDP